MHHTAVDARDMDRQRKAIWDPFDFGARGDGVTFDTAALQSAIDACHESGGGRIVLHSGTFLSGTIYLKSHVTLYIEAGAVLLGSSNADDYPVIESRHPSYSGTYVTNKMLVYAEDASNIAIMGRGTIDGQGNSIQVTPYPRPSFSGRPRIIHFRGCENIMIRDVTLTDSSSWVQSYQSCRNLVIDGVTVESPAVRRNNDGLDLVDCELVRISNCSINSGDDAIVIKSLSPDQACRNITITNCSVRSGASGIKIGTESSGGFEDITVQNCTVYDTHGDAIAIESVDGARIERITVSGITIRKLGIAPVMIRLGNRGRSYRQGVKAGTGSLRDVIIQNIQGAQISGQYGCSVTGLAEVPVINIILQNINLEFEGGGTEEDARRQIPENEDAYPSGRMFGTLPSYGFYIRHARNLMMDNVQLRFLHEDVRPAIVGDDVEDLRIKDCRLQGATQAACALRLVGVRNAMISQNQLTSEVPVFLTASGGISAGIHLLNNSLERAGKTFTLGDGAAGTAVTESGNL